MLSDFDQIKIQFEQFISTLSSILPCIDERIRIENKLRRHFNQTSTSYLCSEDFTQSLNRISQIFNSHDPSSKYFTALASFDDQMKKNFFTKTSRSSITITKRISNKVETEKKQDEHLINDVQHTINDLLDRATAIRNEQETIEKLERKLQRLSKLIHRLEQTDMSLDEMNNCDLYLVESNLKQRALAVYEKLTKLKNESNSTERIIHRKLMLPVIDRCHPMIHSELERWTNHLKYFPSFNDVLNLVRRINQEKELNLNEQNEREIAEKSLKVIGKQMKQRRMDDFHDIMNSRLPENFNIEENDPAIGNEAMENVLKSNQEEASRKTEQIMDMFAHCDETIEPNEEEKPDEPTSATIKCSTNILKAKNEDVTSENDLIYQLYQQRLTNPNHQQTILTDSNNAQQKRSRKRARFEETDIIVLD